MAKITISIGPTFLDPTNDIYHKASAAIEFDEKEKEMNDAIEDLKQVYKKLIKTERTLVKSFRKKSNKKKVRKIINQ